MTRRGRFLATMEHLLPWPELEVSVLSAHERAGHSAHRPGTLLRRMLRIYLLQQWFNLTDLALEEALHDSATMRQFAQVSAVEPVPEEAAIAAFRKLLARYQGADEIMATVSRTLARHGIRIKESLLETPRLVDIERLPPSAPRESAVATVVPPEAPAAPVHVPPSPGLLRPAHAAAVEMALAVLGVGVFEWEPATSCFRFSARCREMLGLESDEQPTGERLLALVHPEDRHQTAVLHTCTRPQGPTGFSMELRVIRPDGGRRWVQISGTAALQESSGTAVRSYGTMLDVTQQRLAQRRLYERESQFLTFIDGAPASLATFDRDMRFIEVSRQYAEDRGFTPAELVGRCLYDVTPIPERWKAVHARCLAGASERSELDFYVRPDGRKEYVWWEIRPWYHEDQSVGGLVLVSEVITQRVRAQRRLHESEARLEAALRAGAFGVYDYDLIENATSWDARVRELWGIPATEEATYKTFISGVHADDRAVALRALEDSLGAGGKGTHASEYRVVHRDGSIRWIASTGTVFFEKGRAVRLVGIVQDITERKRAELALAHSAAELRRADQRKDQFLATLSHELRNPLTPIRNAAYILASPGLTPEQLSWARQVIQRQTAHMASLLNDLLDIARITGGKLALRKEQVRLMAIVDAAIETASPLLNEKRHRLSLSLNGLEPLLLKVDPLRLSQVLSNLLGNAAKYTHSGGEIELMAALTAGSLTLTVRDNGIGMPQEALTRIFEMFWQVRSGDAGAAQGGLGIGLALVKSLVELHGGRIEAKSEGAGRGSELVVQLPLDAAAEAEHIPQRLMLAGSAARCRVLLADDNRDAANTLAMLLELAHHEVRVAHGGAAALQLAESFRPDVALLDIAMPELDGYRVAEALRQAPWAAGMRLIALTGRGQEEDKRRATAAGFDHHMTKPINPEMLAQLLHLQPRLPAVKKA